MRISSIQSLRRGVLVAMVAAFVFTAPVSSRVLQFVESLEYDPPLSYPYSLALSPDGRDVYVAAGGEDALSVFQRDPDTGALTFIETQRNGKAGVDGLATPYHLTVSPDGSHVYATSFGDHALTVFQRDPATGRLRFVEAQFNGLHGVEGLDDPDFVTVSPDGRYVYAGSYYAKSLAVFERDRGSGALHFVEGHFASKDGPLRGMGAINCLLVSPDSRYLYVGDDWDSVAVLEREEPSGRLHRVQMAYIGGGNNLAMSPDGRYVYAAGYYDFGVARRDELTGELTLLETYSEYDTLGYSGVQVSPDGRYVFCFGQQGWSTAVFERDASTGLLRFMKTVQLGGPEPWDMKMSPDGRHLYFTHPYSGRLAVYAWDSSTGSLSSLPGRRDGDLGPVDLHGLRDVKTSPDGRHVFATAVNRLIVFRRNLTTGRLRPLTTESEEGVALFDDLELSPDGRHAYGLVGRFGADAKIVAWSFDGTHATLQKLGAFSYNGSGIYNLTISPDGRHLYALGQLTGVFERDLTTGELRLVETSVDGLDFSESGAFSPDGRYLYASGVDYQEGWMVKVFERLESGALRFVESHVVEEEGRGSVHLTVSPDGRHVYATVEDDQAVFVFERHETTGELRLVEIEEKSGVGSLRRPASVEVSPEGDHVYVANSGETVDVFERDVETGKLDLLEIEVNHLNGVEGLSGTLALASSPDGRNLYVAAPGERALTVFERRDAGCRPGSQALCLNGNRFRVELEWRDFQDKTGAARTAPLATDDSGVLWFFNPENWEMQVKVLDGCRLNDRFWVFASATTNVEYTLKITDTATGDTKSYFNPLGNAAAAITDTDAFATCAGDGARPPGSVTVRSAEHLTTLPAASWKLDGTPGPCAPSVYALCLNDERFRVEVEWGDARGHDGWGRAYSARSDDSGLLWFFGPENWEIMVKVLDGCQNNGHYWVFAAATTDVEYTLRVTDVLTGDVREYLNPLGHSSPAVTDTAAFAGCPPM